MKLYEINREERHFGFLFMSSIIFNDKFRAELFSLFNERLDTSLDPNDFDVYAEVAIFRDYWKSFGDYKKYTQELHLLRLAFLRKLLNSMKINSELIKKEDLFWTKGIETSKLWYPGRWHKEKIRKIEGKHGIDEKMLWRCRWLCNAKPDVMIQSGNNILFIEIKVESGMGSTEEGYNQEQTQEDIIRVGKKLICWMQNTNSQRINLSHAEEEKGILWQDILQILSKHEGTGSGHEMIMKHLSNMPKVV